MTWPAFLQPLLQVGLARFHVASRRIQRICIKINEAKDKRSALREAYPTYLGIKPMWRPYFIIAMVSAIAILDIFFFGAGSSYLASSVSHVPGLGWVALFLTPFCFLGVDLGLGWRIHQSKKNKARWAGFGICFVASLVMLSAGSQISVMAVGGVPIEVSGLLAGSLILLVAVCHAAVVFFGQPLEDVMTFFVVKYQDKKLEKQIVALEEELEEAELKAFELFESHFGKEIYELWAREQIEQLYAQLPEQSQAIP